MERIIGDGENFRRWRELSEIKRIIGDGRVIGNKENYRRWRELSELRRIFRNGEDNQKMGELSEIRFIENVENYRRGTELSESECYRKGEFLEM